MTTRIAISDMTHHCIMCGCKEAKLRPDEAAISTLIYVRETSLEDVVEQLCDTHKMIFIACLDDDAAGVVQLPTTDKPGLAKC